jgi:hypothetical protein
MGLAVTLSELSLCVLGGLCGGQHRRRHCSKVRKVRSVFRDLSVDFAWAGGVTTVMVGSASVCLAETTDPRVSALDFYQKPNKSNCQMSIFADERGLKGIVNRDFDVSICSPFIASVYIYFFFMVPDNMWTTDRLTCP